MPQDIRVLVTGGTGFIGSHVLAEFRRANVDAMGAARRSPSLSLDITDAAAVRSVLGSYEPTHLVHLAGSIAAPSGGVPTLFSSNVAGTAVLLKEAAHVTPQAPIVVLSSSAVYGAAEPSIVSEDALLQPLTPYGLSKAAAEEIAQCRRDAGGDVRIVRAFNLSGPGLPLGLVLSDVAVQLVRGEVVRVGNLDARRDWLDVRDLSEALCSLTLGPTPFDVVNVGSGQSVPVRDCVERMVAMAGGGAIEFDPGRQRPADVPDLRANLDRLRSLLPGWAPRHTLDESLADVVADWRTRAGGTAPS